MASRVNPIWEFLKNNDVQTLSCVSSNLLCMLCNRILINARQTPCGCRYCADCIAEEFRLGSRKCPGKTEDCTDEFLDLNRDIICDNNANREICKLLVKCPHGQCCEEDELRRITDHVLTCDYRQEACELCHQTVLRKDHLIHKSRECNLREVRCEFCENRFTFEDLRGVHHNERHENLCEKYRAACPYNCGLTQAVLLKDHLIVCANRPQPCPYVPIGCSFMYLPRVEMETHLVQEGHVHAKSLVTYIDNLHNEIKALTAANACQSRCIEELTTTLNSRDRDFERRHNDFLWKVEGYSNLLKNAENGKAAFVESKSFLSDRFGYKMQLKLFPNGCENGEGEYVSLYFMILHSKYDDILDWPFKCTVKLTLVNCCGGQDLVKVCNYGSLARDREEPHVGAGVVKFVTIASLIECGFLKKDNLYVRCSVD